MKRLLITSGFMDLHARAVAYAMAQKGHQAVCWYGGDLPVRQTLSLTINSEGTDAAFGGIEMDVPGVTRMGFDAFWYRRFAPPTLPNDMHAGDRQVATLQCRALAESSLPFLDSIPFWINEYSSARRAESKPLQLRVAREIGLSVPETLMTNDPAAIRSFIRQQGGKAAFKLFGPATWVAKDDPDKMVGSYTAIVREDDLPADDVLQLAPGIFQNFVHKRHELRVTCFGDYLVTTRLNSQGEASTELDWRQNQHLMPVEPSRLPDEIANKCRHLMRRLNILYGAIDFIVTPEGEYVFLEINQQGQFLWVEERTAIPVLDMFCEFVIGGKREFQWRDDHEIVRLSDFDAETFFSREETLRGKDMESIESEAIVD